MKEPNYKAAVLEILDEFKNLHRRFIELERCQAETYFERRFSPMDFLPMLTQDIYFQWINALEAALSFE